MAKAVVRHVCDVNNGKNLRTSHLHYNHFQIWNGRMSGFTLTCSVPCWQRVASTNTPCTSLTHSQSMRSSGVRTRRPRLWRRPFSTNGFVNLASRRKFTLMSGRSLLTSFQANFLLDLPFNILKQLLHIHSAMPRLKFSTKRSRST